jgi:glycopeptide antibiotics resistance protein
MTGYGVLAVLGLGAFPGRRAAGLLAGILLLSVGFEFVQAWLLNRTFNPMDILANGTGMAAGAACAAAGERILLSRSKHASTR